MIIRFSTVEFQPTRLKLACAICKSAMGSLRFGVAGVIDSERVVGALDGFCCLACSPVLLGEMLTTNNTLGPRALLN